MEILSVTVYGNSAYVPTWAQMKSGPYLATKPVYVASLNVVELAEMLQKVANAGHPKVPDVVYAEYRRIDPMLKATGAKSWKRLAQNGASYRIEVNGNQMVLYCSKLDDKGRFVNDPTKTRQLPLNQNFRELAEAILSDWTSRNAQ